MADWFLRFFKGILIGSGFILPGVSGGALAAVFGVYERIISFFAHVTKNFKENVLYLIPVGAGGLTGIFLFSFVVSYFLGAYEVQILWLFIGCILGTLPTLWEQAGRQGRQKKHIALILISFVISFAFMYYGERMSYGHVEQNVATWLLAGALIGLGIIIPGFSPSNFLLYMGMYKAMADGIKGLDFMVIIPLFAGAGLTVLLLSKAVNYIFEKAYAGLFHIILGIILASTVMIIPTDVNYLSMGTFICLFCCLLGIAVGKWMCALEKKYKDEER